MRFNNEFKFILKKNDSIQILFDNYTTKSEHTKRKKIEKEKVANKEQIYTKYDCGKRRKKIREK